MQPLAVVHEQLLQARLVDRHLAAAQTLDLLRVDVHAIHLAAELGKAGGGHQPDIAGADHPDWCALFARHQAGKANRWARAAMLLTGSPTPVGGQAALTKRYAPAGTGVLRRGATQLIV